MAFTWLPWQIRLIPLTPKGELPYTFIKLFVMFNFDCNSANANLVMIDFSASFFNIFLIKLTNPCRTLTQCFR